MKISKLTEILQLVGTLVFALALTGLIVGYAAKLFF